MAILETILAGGATGIIGNVLGQLGGFFIQGQKNKQEIKMHERDMISMIKEAEIDLQRDSMKTQADLAKSAAALEMIREKIEGAGWMETIKQNAKDKLSSKALERLFDRGWTVPFGVLLAVLFGLVDVIKALVRPALTAGSTYFVIFIYIASKDILDQLGGSLNEAMAQQLNAEIVHTALYVFTSIVFWWFGDRRSAKTLSRINAWK